jgi:hypothetical protein
MRKPNPQKRGFKVSLGFVKQDKEPLRTAKLSLTSKRLLYFLRGKNPEMVRSPSKLKAIPLARVKKVINMNPKSINTT